MFCRFGQGIIGLGDPWVAAALLAIEMHRLTSASYWSSPVRPLGFLLSDGPSSCHLIAPLMGRFRTRLLKSLACDLASGSNADLGGQAPAPSRPTDHGLAGTGLLAHVLVSKYANHTPLYRKRVVWAVLMCGCQSYVST